MENFIAFPSFVFCIYAVFSFYKSLFNFSFLLHCVAVSIAAVLLFVYQALLVNSGTVHASPCLLPLASVCP